MSVLMVDAMAVMLHGDEMARPQDCDGRSHEVAGICPRRLAWLMVDAMDGCVAPRRPKAAHAVGVGRGDSRPAAPRAKHRA